MTTQTYGSISSAFDYSRPTSAAHSIESGIDIDDSIPIQKVHEIEEKLKKYSWLECVGCFCCWTLSGLRMLLTNVEIIQYGLGFVVADNFALLIRELVRSLMIPAIFAIMSSPKIYRVQSGNGWISLTDPRLDMGDDVPVKSISPFVSEFDARENGAQVIQYQDFIVAFVNFFLVLSSAYWVCIALRRWGKKNLPVSNMSTIDLLNASSSILVKRRTCDYCFSDIPEKCIRCPECTSFLPSPNVNQQQQLQTNNDLEIGINNKPSVILPISSSTPSIPDELSDTDKQRILDALALLLSKPSNNNQ